MTLADMFEPYIGVTEWNGIVRTIQEWYYGGLVKASWCATSVSYFANQMGILMQLGGKNENVNQMRLSCAGSGYGTYFDNPPSQLRRGDILFWLWSGSVMSNSSNKHVGVCYDDTTDTIIPCIGGNQSDMICVQNYRRSALYAVFRPTYEDVGPIEPNPDPTPPEDPDNPDTPDPVYHWFLWALLGHYTNNIKR